MSQPVLAWLEQLDIGQSIMDDTRREFVAQLNRVGAAADAGVPAALDDFIAHRETHFGQEERGMGSINFPPAPLWNAGGSPALRKRFDCTGVFYFETHSGLAPDFLLQPRYELPDRRARGGVRGDDDEVFARARDAILEGRDQRPAF